MTNPSKRWLQITLFTVAAAATASAAAAGSAVAGDDGETRLVEWEEPVDDKTSVPVAAELHYDGVAPPKAGSPEEEKATARARALGRALVLGVLDNCIPPGPVGGILGCHLVIVNDGAFESHYEWRCWPRN